MSTLTLAQALILSVVAGLVWMCIGTLRSLRDDVNTLWKNPAQALDRLRGELDAERQAHDATRAAFESEMRLSARVIQMQLQTIKELEAQIDKLSAPAQASHHDHAG